MAALVFMDTETTGLSLSDDIWEFAAIRREEDGTEQEFHYFIDHDEIKCMQLPEFFLNDHRARWNADAALPLFDAMVRIDKITAGAHIVGACPNFDTERIAIGLKKLGLLPRWHYHLIDVENLSVGFLYAHELVTKVTLPWDSDQLSKAIGVEPPTTARHTAMGDVFWARAIYDKIITGGK